MHAPAYPSPSFAGNPLPRSSLALFQTTRPSLIKDNGNNRYAPDREQRNRGLEWNIAGVVTPGLRLSGGATYLKAINTRARARLLDGRTAMGSRLVGQHARRMGYPWLPGLTLRAAAIHTGRQYADNANTRKLPAWTRVDLGAGTSPGWRRILSLSVRAWKMPSISAISQARGTASPPSARHVRSSWRPAWISDMRPIA
ncbi:TonB-dependent receptor domain-containing protein [Achromobacter ruhlandii]|uniref:TonB-dependent receptor domain-containing protein n=1 Tax=Achromobacter ruhlandii TaxID=72557 RepID=UPI0011B0C5DE